jgi:hypothetical protein
MSFSTGRNATPPLPKRSRAIAALPIPSENLSSAFAISWIATAGSLAVTPSALSARPTFEDSSSAPAMPAANFWINPSSVANGVPLISA